MLSALHRRRERTIVELLIPPLLIGSLELLGHLMKDPHFVVDVYLAIISLDWGLAEEDILEDRHHPLGVKHMLDAHLLHESALLFASDGLYLSPCFSVEALDVLIRSEIGIVII